MSGLSADITQILKTMNEGLCIVDNADKIVYANKKFCEMVGYSF